jgi:hypothetical protein
VKRKEKRGRGKKIGKKGREGREEEGKRSSSAMCRSILPHQIFDTWLPEKKFTLLYIATGVNQIPLFFFFSL